MRARTGYVEPSLARERRDAAAAEAAPLRKAIAGLLPKGDVPLQAWAAAFPLSGRREARVAVGVGMRPSLSDRPTRVDERIDVTIQAFTPEGRPRRSHALEGRLVLRPGPAGEATFEMLSSLDLPPGRYQLRIGAVLRSTRASGSVYYDLDVPDFTRTPVSLSALALHAAPGVISAGTDAAPLPALPPTTARLFDRTDRVTVLARVVRRDRQALTDVAWRASVLDASGRPVWATDGALPASGFVGGLADLQLVLPIDAWPPGAYLCTIELRSAAGDPVRREIRFSRR